MCQFCCATEAYCMGFLSINESFSQIIHLSTVLNVFCKSNIVHHLGNTFRRMIALICFAVFTNFIDVIMSAMASQITSVSIISSTVCSGGDQRKYQSSGSLAFVRGKCFHSITSWCTQPSTFLQNINPTLEHHGVDMFGVLVSHVWFPYLRAASLCPSWWPRRAYLEAGEGTGWLLGPIQGHCRGPQSWR